MGYRSILFLAYHDLTIRRYHKNLYFSFLLWLLLLHPLIYSSLDLTIMFNIDIILQRIFSIQFLDQFLQPAFDMLFMIIILSREVDPSCTMGVP